MGLIDATLNIGATAMAGVITQVGLASGDPGAAGTANPTTAPKQSVAWTVPASGDFANNADINFAGGAPGGPCTYITLWQGSTYRGFKVIVGDQAFNAAGQYRIPAGLLVVNGSSTT